MQWDLIFVWVKFYYNYEIYKPRNVFPVEKNISLCVYNCSLHTFNLLWLVWMVSKFFFKRRTPLFFPEIFILFFNT